MDEHDDRKDETVARQRDEVIKRELGGHNT